MILHETHKTNFLREPRLSEIVLQGFFSIQIITTAIGQPMSNAGQTAVPHRQQLQQVLLQATFSKFSVRKFPKEKNDVKIKKF